MFLVKWRRLGVHIHCRLFSRSSRAGHWAFMGDITMDEKDWENFQLAILAKYWEVKEEGDD